MYDISYSAASSESKLAQAGIWVVISLVLAIVLGLVVYFMFLTKENESKLTDKKKWVYDFLSFKKLFSEDLLKIAYLITAIFITLSSLSMIGVNFALFIVYLLVGNVVTRLVYEFILAILLICKNTAEINDKLKKEKITKEKTSKKEDK